MVDLSSIHLAVLLNQIPLDFSDPTTWSSCFSSSIQVFLTSIHVTSLRIEYYLITPGGDSNRNLPWTFLTVKEVFFFFTVNRIVFNNFKQILSFLRS